MYATLQHSVIVQGGNTELDIVLLSLYATNLETYMHIDMYVVIYCNTTIVPEHLMLNKLIFTFFKFYFSLLYTFDWTMN